MEFLDGHKNENSYGHRVLTCFFNVQKKCANYMWHFWTTCKFSCVSMWCTGHKETANISLLNNQK